MNFEALAADLASRSRELLPVWFPNGRWKGREFHVGNLSGTEGDSLAINGETGAWADFSGDDRGGDLISLYAAMHGIKQIEAAKQLANGHDFDGIVPVRVEAQKPKRQVTLPPGPIESMRHPKHGEPSRSWEYRDADGSLLGYVARYDPVGGKKQIVPFTYAEPGGWGMGQWPEPRPLYGLHDLAKAPQAAVLVVEGEKAADAARVIVAGRYVVVTWPGGSQAWRKVDWSPLAGRKLLLWPDADRPGAECMVAIGQHLLPNATEVKLLDVTGQPDGWDAADSGFAWDTFLAWAKPRASVVTAIVEAPPVREEPPPVTEAPPEPDVVPEPAVEVPKPEKKRILGAAGSKGQTWAVDYPWEGRPWANRMICTDAGAPKPLLANAITAIELDPDWQGVLAHDSFGLRTVSVKQPPIGMDVREGEWTDVHDSLTAVWLQRHGIQVQKNLAAQAVEVVAHQHAFHPVRDYLNSLTWDGTERLEHWLIDYCTVEDTHYTRSVGKLWLIAGVARIMQPGCKLDNALIFESPQGKGKSSALRVLGGKWFTDDNSEMGTKDSKQEMQGVWIMELAELSSVSRSSIETIKAFIPRQFDRFRAAYAARVLQAPRQAIFGGSVNNREYLKDDHNRRFWPILVNGRINLKALQDARDQLWAEALHRYRAGERWWIDDDLDPELLNAAREQQESRRVVDEWENKFAWWLAEQEAQNTDTHELTVGEVLEKCFGVVPGKWNQIDQNRTVRAMRRYGYDGPIVVKKGGRSTKVYRRADGPPSAE